LKNCLNLKIFNFEKCLDLTSVWIWKMFKIKTCSNF
jgi:hypothetical protein